MPRTTRVVVALVAGLVVGVVVSGTQDPALRAAVGVVEPIGALWVNAIRMTVVPLVVSLLITGIASNTPGNIGRLGGRSLTLFVVLVVAGSVFTASVAPAILSLVEFNADTFAALRARAPSAEVELPPFRDWIIGLVPANPVRAAADGRLLPLIVFSVIFAVAVTRLKTHHRELLVTFFDAVSRAMFVIVEWILIAAPVGVFFLVLPLAADTGVGLVGALGFFLALVCGLLSAAILGLYPIASALGGVGFMQFARACAPAQALAFSTRSSLATLPVMLESADKVLKLPSHVSSLVLPVAVSLFKFASPIARTTGTLFIARLYGIDLGVTEVVAIAAAGAGLSFYSPGIPSGGLFIMTPVYVALGLPVEGVGILIALDLIPDMFMTMGNVTADMVAAVILAKASRSEGAGDRKPHTQNSSEGAASTSD